MKTPKKEIMKKTQQSKEFEKDTNILKLLQKSLGEQQKVEINYNEKINLIVDTISKSQAVLTRMGDEFVYLSNYNHDVGIQIKLRNLHIEKEKELYKTQMKYIDKIVKLIRRELK